MNELTDTLDLVTSVDELVSSINTIGWFLFIGYMSIILGIFIGWWNMRGRDFPDELADANILLQEARYDELHKLCHRVIKRRPNFAESYWFIALNHYHQEQYKQAENYFEKAKTIDPRWSEEIDVYLGRLKEIST